MPVPMTNDGRLYSTMSHAGVPSPYLLPGQGAAAGEGCAGDKVNSDVVRRLQRLEAIPSLTAVTRELMQADAAMKRTWLAFMAASPMDAGVIPNGWQAHLTT